MRTTESPGSMRLGALETSSSSRVAPWFLRVPTVVGTCVVAAVAVVALFVPLQVQADQYAEAVGVFEGAVADRVAVYDEQVEPVEGLHAAEAALTAEYPVYVSIGSTLTDGTVADPALRVGLLSAAAEYAEADLALDGAGAFVVERPALYDVLEQERLVEAEDGSVSDFSAEELRSQAAVLVADTEMVRSYIGLVEDTAAGIRAAAEAAAVAADAVIASAAEKGATLVWDRAPAETAAVVAAAGALVPAAGEELRSLEDRAALVSAYVASVGAAAAAHQVVLDREAEAARQAAAAEAERQAAAQRQTRNTGGGDNPSSRGTSGGQSSQNSGGSIPQGGGRPGGGTNQTNGGCWTSNGAGGTMPCGGW